jgi:light-regulated signal transduction histidine kinase (bacteriophytochrome)
MAAALLLRLLGAGVGAEAIVLGVIAAAAVAWLLLHRAGVQHATMRVLEESLTAEGRAEETDRRLAGAAAELQRRATELERSNADLRQFAYVASHDLSEPLRTVRSYLQLLARRYQGRLGSDADEFIDFAVGGATRMQALIDGLLVYSLAGTSTHTRVSVDCTKVVHNTLATMEALVREKGAAVTVESLPTLYGDETQLAQLFQNLLSNALKFVSDRPPRVRISAVQEGAGWLFSVEDNGIGIEPRHVERAFKVFQRLQSREAYPGSGIGLAICKRIVERHGGRIWAEPVAGGGTAFRFTIPGRESSRDSILGD